MHPSILVPILVILACITSNAHAQGVLYRCESTDGISIQGSPCPKGATQRKIDVQRQVGTAPSPTPAPVVRPVSTTIVPVAPRSAMHGPNEPYPLWECMRADGSTFESRDGVPGKQWVLQPVDPDADAAPAAAQVKMLPSGSLVRPIENTSVESDEPVPDPTPPPAGAGAGQWVADQCTRLPPQQACERFAVRRDALRKQIYAAKPSERATYAPEEQDLTSMLFATCGR